MLISLFPTPFDHFHFHGSGGLILWYDLRLWPTKLMLQVGELVRKGFNDRWVPESHDQVFDLSIKKSYHVLSAASSGALRSWDPGEAWAWIPYLHFIATPPWSSPPQYLHSRVTSDWQTHFKLFCYLTFCHMFFSLANTLYIGVCLLSTDHVKQCLFWCWQQMMSHSLEILFCGDVR